MRGGGGGGGGGGEHNCGGNVSVRVNEKGPVVISLKGGGGGGAGPLWG